MEQLTKSKNKYCAKCGKSIKDDGVGVKDIAGNMFCDNECKREYWLEIRQDWDDVYREVWRQDN